MSSQDQPFGNVSSIRQTNDYNNVNQDSKNDPLGDEINLDHNSGAGQVLG